MLYLLVFLQAGLLSGQSYQGASPSAAVKGLFQATAISGNPTAGKNREKNPSIAAFSQAAKEHGILSRKISGIPDLENGYYLVAGVFGQETNAENFVRRLKDQNLKAGRAYRPENGMHYVFASYDPAWQGAISKAISALDGMYAGKLWIMEVQETPPADTGVVPSSKAEDSGSRNSLPVHSFKEACALYKIPSRKADDFPSADTGYYLMAGVFSTPSNAEAFMKKLAAKKIAAGTLTHPGSQKQYVHLGRYLNWQEAIAAAISKLDGRYREPVWILDRTASNANDLVEEPTSLLLPLSQKGGAKDPPNLEKLIEKADNYFHKMWYAEAAELYETALEQMQDPSFKIIEKAGDSHYFNTNMERAYHWYNLLFEKYRKELSADNLFKYAHSLKGTGRYGRAKRLMRLYNREAAKEETFIPGDDAGNTAQEILLDKILNEEQQLSIRNLDINSRYSEFAPMFHNTNELVFASSVDSAFFTTRRYKWNDQPFLDLYVAKINEESEEVRGAVKFSKKINTKYHEAAVTFSPDNNSMYFTRNNYGKKLKRDKQGVNHLKIYRSVKVAGEWTEAVELPFNSDSYSTGHPALSPDGKQLYFVSDMPGSIGETDIFVVDVLEDGTFSEPRNLGPEINTERKEMFPFINHKKLYFSSDGHVGLGGLDVYEVSFDDAEGFLEVRNLGRPINSNKDDFSYIVDEETQKGFFASNRKGGKGDDDLYSFKRLLPEEPNKNAIAGVVTELVTGTALPEAMVVLLDENNRKLKELVTGADGSFVFEDLESATKYSLKTVKADYHNEEQQVSTASNEQVNVSVSLKRLDERIIVEEGIKKLRTDMIYFDFDQSRIRPDAAMELDKLVSVMTEYKDMVIKIAAHTDSRGPSAYNKYLSDKRAKASRAYLIGKGIAPERIESAIGYGEEQLLNDCDGSIACSSEKHQLNRRSEFIIVRM